VKTSLAALCPVLWVAIASRAFAETPPAVPVAGTTASEATVVAAPYALPWQLRPVGIVNVLRLDATPSTYRDKNDHAGFVTTSVLTASRVLTKQLMAVVRVTAIMNRPVDADANNLANPVFGLMQVSKHRHVKLGLFLAVTAPVGSGGSSQPNKFRQAANPVGALSRGAMDNALFAVNYSAVIPGIGAAYNAHQLTVQGEATLFALARVRGSSADNDVFRLNGTAGLSVGYTFAPNLAAIAELHYQRWLVNETVDAAVAPARQNLSVMLGPRFTIKTRRLTLRPGIALGIGLVGAVANNNYSSPVHSVTTVFVDLPVIL